MERRFKCRLRSILDVMASSVICFNIIRVMFVRIYNNGDDGDFVTFPFDIFQKIWVYYNFYRVLQETNRDYEKIINLVKGSWGRKRSYRGVDNESAPINPYYHTAALSVDYTPYPGINEKLSLIVIITQRNEYEPTYRTKQDIFSPHATSYEVIWRDTRFFVGFGVCNSNLSVWTDHHILSEGHFEPYSRYICYYQDLSTFIFEPRIFNRYI